MKAKKVEVWWDGTRVGELAATGSESFFAYDPEFINRRVELSPIEMPLRVEPYLMRGIGTEALPVLVRDSLPGAYAYRIMEQWFAQHYGGREVTHLDRLCYVGSFAMGALVYKPDIDFPKSERRKLILKEQARLAQSQTAASIDKFRRNTRTVGGAYPKALAVLEQSSGNWFEDDWRLGSGYDHFVIKFGTPPNLRTTLNNYPEIEQVYLSLAKEVGINTVETQLLDSSESGVRHLGSLRFDRVAGERIHMATLGGLVTKTKELGEYNYQDLFRVAAVLTKDQGTAKEIFRRMTFNVLSHNTDDHARNHSFLMNKTGSWQLSPAYDVSFLDNSSGQIEDQSLLVMGKSREITSKDLVEEGMRAGLSRSFCIAAMHGTAAVLQKATDELKQGGVSKADAVRIQSKLNTVRTQVLGRSWAMPAAFKPKQKKTGRNAGAGPRRAKSRRRQSP